MLLHQNASVLHRRCVNRACASESASFSRSRTSCGSPWTSVLNSTVCCVKLTSAGQRAITSDREDWMVAGVIPTRLTCFHASLRRRSTSAYPSHNRRTASPAPQTVAWVSAGFGGCDGSSGAHATASAAFCASAHRHATSVRCSTQSRTRSSPAIGTIVFVHLRDRHRFSRRENEGIDNQG